MEKTIQSLLWTATKANRIKEIGPLIAKGAQPNEPDENGESPLEWAIIYSGNLNLIRSLMPYDSYLEDRLFNRLLNLWPTLQSDPYQLRKLFNLLEEVNNTTAKNQEVLNSLRTFLSLPTDVEHAIRDGDVKKLSSLLRQSFEEKRDLQTTLGFLLDWLGETENALECAKLLVQYGADGTTELADAIREGNVQLTSFLLKIGVNPNTLPNNNSLSPFKTVFGRLLLSDSVSSRLKSIVSSYGLDIHSTEQWKTNLIEIATALLQYGAGAKMFRSELFSLLIDTSNTALATHLIVIGFPWRGTPQPQTNLPNSVTLTETWSSIQRVGTKIETALQSILQDINLEVSQKDIPTVLSFISWITRVIENQEAAIKDRLTCHLLAKRLPREVSNVLLKILQEDRVEKFFKTLPEYPTKEKQTIFYKIYDTLLASKSSPLALFAAIAFDYPWLDADWSLDPQDLLWSVAQHKKTSFLSSLADKQHSTERWFQHPERLNIVKFLIGKGADLYAKDHQNQSLLERAMTSCHVSHDVSTTIALLREGANIKEVEHLIDQLGFIEHPKIKPFLANFLIAGCNMRSVSNDQMTKIRKHLTDSLNSALEPLPIKVNHLNLHWILNFISSGHRKHRSSPERFPLGIVFAQYPLFTNTILDAISDALKKEDTPLNYFVTHAFHHAWEVKPLSFENEPPIERVSFSM